MSVVTEWIYPIVAIVGTTAGVTGSAMGFYGRYLENRFKNYVNVQFNAAMTGMTEKMDQLEGRVSAQHTTQAHEFGETVKAIRERVGEIELNTERNFVPKEEFVEFRREYRDDQRAINGKLDQLIQRN